MAAVATGPDYLLDVTPEILSMAGEKVVTTGNQLKMALSNMQNNTIPWCGSDIAGTTFALNFHNAAQKALDSGSAAVNACWNLGYGIQTSAVNYSTSEAGSTVGGSGYALPTPTHPGNDLPHVAPAQSGAPMPEPTLWHVVQMFLGGQLWPSGNPSQMRTVAALWKSTGTAISGMADSLSGPTSLVSGQQIPESSVITNALNDMKSGITDVGKQFQDLGNQLESFANDIEDTQNSIKDLLNQIGSIASGGILGAIKDTVSGEMLKKIKRIAHDISQILHRMKQIIQAYINAIDLLLQMLDDLIVKFEKYYRKEFVKFLGPEVGNALADYIDFRLDIAEGLVKSVAGGVQTILSLGLPETWVGLGKLAWANSPIGMMTDPMNTLKMDGAVIKQLVSAGDWNSDRPGVWIGKFGGDLGQLFIGTGEVAAGSRAAKAAAAAGRVEDAAVVAGRAEKASEVGKGWREKVRDAAIDSVRPDNPFTSVPDTVKNSGDVNNKLNNASGKFHGPDAQGGPVSTPTVPQSLEPTDEFGAEGMHNAPSIPESLIPGRTEENVTPTPLPR